MRLFVLSFALFTIGGSLPLAAKDHPVVAHPGDGRLFSQSALRRTRIIIQMKMLELRVQRLECLREMLVRRLPPDLISQGEIPDAVKHSSAHTATTHVALGMESEDCSWLSIPPSR
jgi:hypothetical protein